MFNWVKTLFSVAVVAIALLPACTSTLKVVEHPAKVLTVVRRTVHADTVFNTWERAAIADAVGRLNLQTNGLIELSVVYDLDWENGSVSDIVRLEGYHQLVRIKSDAPIVGKMDGDRKDGLMTQGYCKVDFEFLLNPTKIYIIYDRLTYSSEMYVHVVFHEFLHSFGMQHVTDSASVMYFKSSHTPQLCMNMTDAKELCRVYHCEPTDLNYCE